MTAKVAVVLGTRPEVVKLAHVIRLLGDGAMVVHTGQHYDNSLSRVFFEAFELAEPAVALEIGGASRGAQIGEATSQLDALFDSTMPAAVVVQGDTNTALAGGLAANARSIPLIHVEAGLRSHDRAMPEEHNRVLVDHIADLCLAPTQVNVDNLLGEGIPRERIEQTGNTVVEAVTELLPSSERRSQILEGFGLGRSRFVLATLHRPENVDDPGPLARVLDELRSLPVPVLYPVHPRTAATVKRAGLSLDGIRTTEPLDYMTFLGLAAECAALISDSGGVQEEASVIKRPVAVVRRSTERPEVQGTFAILLGPEDGIAEAVGPWLEDPVAHHERLRSIPSPYGDGSASMRTVEAIRSLLN